MGEDDTSPERRPLLQRGIRASTTRSTAALWSKSLFNALAFFAIFMVALPWGAHQLIPLKLPLPESLAMAAAALLALSGIAVWAWGLDVFSRRGHGTPFPLDAPRVLATEGPFAHIRNPIMASELVVIWSVVLYLGSLGVSIYAIAITLLAHALVVRVEEPELRRRFGATYDAYCERVPRWIPGASAPSAKRG